ncbi:MAG: accessory gene regulator B family protein [Eubacterium sp.]|nr:accessory gene regulator B family protein [Eubacterium sp.]
MFAKIARSLTLWLKKHDAIEAELQDAYEYAIFNILHIIVPICIVICMGIAMNIFLESLLLFLPFLLIRKYSGGYHMKTARRCLIGTSIMLFLCIIMARHLQVGFLFVMLVSFGVISLMINSPIDSDNRRLTTEEKEYCHKKAIRISAFCETIFITMIAVGIPRISGFWGMGIIMSASLQVPVIIRDRFCEKIDQ